MFDEDLEVFPSQKDRELMEGAHADFSSIATNIVRSLRPKRIVLLGEGTRELLPELWDRGVEAVAYAFSADAISPIQPDLQAYVGHDAPRSAIQDRVDLAVWLGAPPEILPANLPTAVGHVCAAAETVLFAPTFRGASGPRAASPLPVLVWLKQFSGHGYWPDLLFDASFVAPQAMLLRKSRDGLPDTALLGYAEMLRLRLVSGDDQTRRARLESAIESATTGIIDVSRDTDALLREFGTRSGSVISPPPNAAPMSVSAEVPLELGLGPQDRASALTRAVQHLRTVHARLVKELTRLQGNLSAPSIDLQLLVTQVTRQSEELRVLDRQLSQRGTEHQEYSSAWLSVKAERDQLAHQLAVARSELAAVRSSIVWRLASPLRALARRFPWLARQFRRTIRLVWWTVTLQLHKRVPEIIRHRRSVGLTPNVPAEGGGRSTAERRSVPSGPEQRVEQILETRFKSLSPLPVYRVDGIKPRITIVTDSINKGSLYGGVATSIILSVLLAERLNRQIRIVTRTEPAEEANFGQVLLNAGIDWQRNIEFQFCPPTGTKELDICDDDVFVTTSWWTTKCTMQSVNPKRIVYILQEDERMFYPSGDDQLLCGETLASDQIRTVVNSKLLFDELVRDGFENIRRSGLSFEPAFPGNAYFYEQRRPEKMNFFFYARPMNVRNLFYRGLEVIDEAIRCGMLRSDEWDIHLVGKDLMNIVFTGNVRPIVRQDLSWSDYTALVRRMDLGLSLMSTPHPSYPPLDLAASGAVVVTNRYGAKQDLDRYSRNIICADLGIDSLVEGIKRGIELARDESRRFQNYQDNAMLRDWRVAFANVIDKLGRDFDVQARHS